MSLHNDSPISPRCGKLGWTDAHASAYHRDVALATQNPPDRTKVTR
jgi:hypothetical protein